MIKREKRTLVVNFVTLNLIFEMKTGIFYTCRTIFNVILSTEGIIIFDNAMTYGQRTICLLNIDKFITGFFLLKDVIDYLHDVANNPNFVAIGLLKSFVCSCDLTSIRKPPFSRNNAS